MWEAPRYIKKILGQLCQKIQEQNAPVDQSNSVAMQS